MSGKEREYVESYDGREGCFVLLIGIGALAALAILLTIGYVIFYVL